jgi:hypothetical protein
VKYNEWYQQAKKWVFKMERTVAVSCDSGILEAQAVKVKNDSIYPCSKF